MQSLPPISTVPTLVTTERAAILDTLFEPSTQLHTLSVSTLHERTFSTYNGLVEAIGAQLTSLFQSDLHSDQEWLDAILSAHPRLGEKKPADLSESSRKEQSQLQEGEHGEKELEMISSLNQDYEFNFPGLRYVVFVNGRKRTEIIQDMIDRIDRGDRKQERLDAIKAMIDIARDRAKKLDGDVNVLR